MTLASRRRPRLPFQPASASSVNRSSGFRDAKRRIIVRSSSPDAADEECDDGLGVKLERYDRPRDSHGKYLPYNP